MVQGRKRDYRILNPFRADGVDGLRDAMECVIKRMTPRRNNQFLEDLEKQGAAMSVGDASDQKPNTKHRKSK